jgi:hypothetical protein
MHSFPQCDHSLARGRICRMSVDFLLGSLDRPETPVLKGGRYTGFCGEALVLFATVSRGKNRGARLLPHRFKDQRYHVQLGKQGPYIRSSILAISTLPGERYSLQMSVAESVTPTLIRPESIVGGRETLGRKGWAEEGKPGGQSAGRRSPSWALHLKSLASL